MAAPVPRLVLLGIGAMASPRYAPAGLLLEDRDIRVMIDGGPGAEPPRRIAAWLVTDPRAELMPAIRVLARERGVTPAVAPFRGGRVEIEPRAVVHTSHPAFGYLIHAPARIVAWAPEFLELPDWARGVDLLFADAAGWRRPIRFAKGVGGHAAALQVAEQARAAGVRRLVFAHLGRPTLRAIDRGELLPFGEFGREGAAY